MEVQVLMVWLLPVSVLSELKVRPWMPTVGDGTVLEGSHLNAVDDHSYFSTGCLWLGTGSGTKANMDTREVLGQPDAVQWDERY